jgi:hypothetical protein
MTTTFSQAIMDFSSFRKTEVYPPPFEGDNELTRLSNLRVSGTLMSKRLDSPPPETGEEPVLQQLSCGRMAREYML